MKIGRDELAELIHEAVDPIDDPSLLGPLDWRGLYAVAKGVERVGEPDHVEPIAYRGATLGKNASQPT